MIIYSKIDDYHYMTNTFCEKIDINIPIKLENNKIWIYHHHDYLQSLKNPAVSQKIQCLFAMNRTGKQLTKQQLQHASCAQEIALNNSVAVGQFREWIPRVPRDAGCLGWSNETVAVPIFCHRFDEGEVVGFQISCIQRQSGWSIIHTSELHFLHLDMDVNPIC